MNFPPRPLDWLPSSLGVLREARKAYYSINIQKPVSNKVAVIAGTLFGSATLSMLTTSTILLVAPAVIATGSIALFYGIPLILIITAMLMLYCCANEDDGPNRRAYNVVMDRAWEERCRDNQRQLESITGYFNLTRITNGEQKREIAEYLGWLLDQSDRRVIGWLNEDPKEVVTHWIVELRNAMEERNKTPDEYYNLLMRKPPGLNTGRTQCLPETYEYLNAKLQRRDQHPLSDDSFPYQVLGVRCNATKGEIKRAYNALQMKFHPDKNLDPEAGEATQVIVDAYEILFPEASTHVPTAVRKPRLTLCYTTSAATVS